LLKSLDALRRSVGNFSCEAVTQEALSRLQSVNSALNCVREVDPTAIDQAKRCDGMDSTLPLRGVPVIVKDNVATAGMRTTAGVRALADMTTDRDAFIVQRLRAAGAIILCKANMPDFADYMSSSMPSSHSGAGGVVSHPYTGQEYGRGGGSSVGVACAVAAGISPVGIGSETQNSIQAPCCNTGLVGIKPTLGLVSRAGVVPLAISQDTAGPIATCVRDACVVLNVIAGPDWEDSLTLNSLGHLRDFTKFCEPDLKGLKIGIVRGFAMWKEKAAYAEHCAVIEQVLQLVARAGAEIVDVEIKTADQVSDLSSRVFKTDFKAGLNHFLSSWGRQTSMKSMAEVVEYNEANPEAIPYGMDLLQAANQAEGTWTEADYHQDRARDMRLCREEGIDECLVRTGVDVLLAPMDRAAKMLGKAGYPAISIPCGFTPAGAPVGLTFFGTAFSEPVLIHAAYGTEQALSGCDLSQVVGSSL